MTDNQNENDAVELTDLTAVQHEITENGVTTHRQPFAGTITIRHSDDAEEQR